MNAASPNQDNLALLLYRAGLRPKNLIFYVNQNHTGLPSRECFHFPLADNFGRQILNIVCYFRSMRSFQLILPLKSYGWYLPTSVLLKMDSTLFTSDEIIIWEGSLGSCDDKGDMDRCYPRASRLLELMCGIQFLTLKHEWISTRARVTKEGFTNARLIVQVNSPQAFCLTYHYELTMIRSVYADQRS
jgi:hypothetical protein